MVSFFVSLFLFFLPFQVAFPIGNEAIPLLRLLALPLVFFWLGRLLVQKATSLPAPLFLGFFLGWLLSVCLSVLVAIDPSLGWRKFFYLLNLFPLLLVWQSYLNKREERIRAFFWLIWGAVISASIGIVFFLAQFIFGVASVFHFLIEKVLPTFLGEHLSQLVALYPSLLVNIGGQTWLRATAFFPDPHVASFFFGITACLALGAFLDTKKYFFLYASLILFLADLLTFSRGGYVGLLAAAIIFLFVGQPTKKLKTALIIFGGIVFPLLLLFGMPVYERFFSVFTLADTSSLDRLALWQTAWETWWTHPWFGLGLGNYAEWIYPGVGATLPYYAHNLYLDMAVETGIVGLSFFLASVGVALWYVWPRIREDSGLALGIAAALVLYLAHSFFETALFSVPIAILVTLLMAFACSENRKNSPVQ